VLVNRLNQLVKAGLDSAEGPSITVVLGHSKPLGCFVTRWFEGPSGEDLIARGDGDRLAELVKQWVSIAKTVQRGELEVYTAKSLLLDLHRWQDMIGAADSRLGAMAAACVSELSKCPPSGGTYGLVHGSFAFLHLVDLGKGPGVLDWDEPRYGPIELDLGTMRASLVRQSLLRADHAASAAQAAAAIGEISINEDAVAWFHQASLIKYAKHMCNLQPPDWKTLATNLVSGAHPWCGQASKT
jgi:aminoglycoside phosphotransferase (APT) family kinase protein